MDRCKSSPEICFTRSMVKLKDSPNSSVNDYRSFIANFRRQKNLICKMQRQSDINLINKQQIDYNTSKVLSAKRNKRTTQLPRKIKIVLPDTFAKKYGTKASLDRRRKCTFVRNQPNGIVLSVDHAKSAKRKFMKTHARDLSSLVITPVKISQQNNFIS